MIFDTTIQKTEKWLKEIMELMSWDNRHMAYDGLQAVLHAVRDRLPIEAAVKFGAQLPMLVRGFYYEGWVPTAGPIKAHTVEDFFKLVQENLRRTSVRDVNPEQLVMSVFKVIKNHVDSGEIEKIKAMLPKPIAHLWENSHKAARAA